MRRSRTIASLSTIAVSAAVALAFAAQNIRQHPSVVTLESDGEVWEGIIAKRGWPLLYAETINSRLVSSVLGYRGPTAHHIVKQPTGDWRDPRTLAIVGNVALGILLIGSAFYVTRFWMFERNPTFQISIRTMLIATAVIAMAIALINGDVLHWSIVLYVPIAFALFCVPIAFGVVLYDAIRRRNSVAESESNFLD